MNKKTIERLEHRLCTELDEIAEKEKISPGDLEVIDKATHSLKSMAAIKHEDEGGYSMAGGAWTAQGDYGRRGGYGYADGMMMDDGRYPQRGRDRMGRYSRAEGPDEMRDKVREMIDSGKLDTAQREAANKLMDTLMK